MGNSLSDPFPEVIAQMASNTSNPSSGISTPIRKIKLYSGGDTGNERQNKQQSNIFRRKQKRTVIVHSPTVSLNYFTISSHCCHDEISINAHFISTGYEPTQTLRSVQWVAEESNWVESLFQGDHIHRREVQWGVRITVSRMMVVILKSNYTKVKIIQCQLSHVKCILLALSSIFNYRIIFHKPSTEWRWCRQNKFQQIPFSSSLETKLGTTPVTPLCVVFDGIVRTKTNPLGKRTVLSLLLGKSTLGAERLLRRLL